MRTFHTGGVASAEDITQGLPRVQEIFEARMPKGRAPIAEAAGRVEIEETDKARKVLITPDDGSEVQEYPVSKRSRLLVGDGDHVEVGQKLIVGTEDPHDVLRILGVRTAQEHLVQEVQAVYRSQGVSIHDKHIEIIVRQMLRRITVIESGDTNILPADLVDRVLFENENRRVVSEGGKPASGRPVLMGITKASLATESWLSAASFQETTRVLTDAAIHARSDSLRGLKENVIIGKLIPAGTGLERYRNIRVEPTEEARAAAYSVTGYDSYDYEFGNASPARGPGRLRLRSVPELDALCRASRQRHGLTKAGALTGLSGRGRGRGRAGVTKQPRRWVSHGLAAASTRSASVSRVGPVDAAWENLGVNAAAPLRTDVLVVGAGPAGSAAAAWAAQAGLDVLLTDAAVFPRDKTCGDGLTPRAIGELQKLGLEDWLRAHTVNRGLRAHGFGQTLLSRLAGRDAARLGFGRGADRARRPPADHRDQGGRRGDRRRAGGRRTHGRRAGRGGGVLRGSAEDGERFEVACDRVVVADGVRSPLGKVLGREWHRETVYGVAGRCYVDSTMSDDPWISSHLELRGEDEKILTGYGWIFPLGNGEVNIGVGTLATSKRPANVAIKPLMRFYADQRRAEFGLEGELRMPTSALLPMGGAVSGVAGANWALIGDAAACVNPLNGEGIDYGLESGRLVVEAMTGARRPVARLAGRAPRAVRRVVLDRAAAGGPGDGAAAAAGAGPGGDALGLADDAGAAVDGQPGHRRGPRPGRPRVALGGPAVAGP